MGNLKDSLASISHSNARAQCTPRHGAWVFASAAQLNDLAGSPTEHKSKTLIEEGLNLPPSAAGFTLLIPLLARRGCIVLSFTTALTSVVPSTNLNDHPIQGSDPLLLKYLVYGLTLSCKRAICDIGSNKALIAASAFNHRTLEPLLSP